MKKIYSEGKNPFAGKKLINYKKTVIYPNSGNIRFSVQLDKNGQVCEIKRSYAQIIKDPETNKRFTKITLGDRPRALFEHIKGRPFELATSWIDIYVNETHEEKSAEN